MRASFWAAIVLLIVGTLVILLPDNEDAMLRFTNGPTASWQQFIGAGIILVTWGWMLAKSIQRRILITRAIGRKGVIAALAAIVLGTVFFVGGCMVTFNKALWWGIILALAGNGMIMVPAFKMNQAGDQ